MGFSHQFRIKETWMSHRYRVREIAQQAGLSEATVDRVLHNRANVRESTRREVEQAIGDLDKQRSQLRLAGRKYLVDVVMQAPQRFSSAFQAAVEAELPALAPAVVRSRFHLRETGSVPAMVETLERSEGAVRLRRCRQPGCRGQRGLPDQRVAW
jgi:LacI family transcriptional regulator